MSCLRGIIGTRMLQLMPNDDMIYFIEFHLAWIEGFVKGSSSRWTGHVGRMASDVKNEGKQWYPLYHPAASNDSSWNDATALPCCPLSQSVQQRRTTKIVQQSNQRGKFKVATVQDHHKNVRVIN